MQTFTQGDTRPEEHVMSHKFIDPTLEVLVFDQMIGVAYCLIVGFLIFLVAGAVVDFTSPNKHKHLAADLLVCSFACCLLSFIIVTVASFLKCVISHGSQL